MSFALLGKRKYVIHLYKQQYIKYTCKNINKVVKRVVVVMIHH